MNVIIAYSRNWYREMRNELSQKHPEVSFHAIESPDELTFEKVSAMNPAYIFFPHWSHYIDASIYDNFETVIFHMTDLPFGRGGSPLQNLIAKGIYETKISALKCVEQLDAGPIYMKKSLSLDGNAEEIYLRASAVVSDMISEIVDKRPTPVEQEGEVVTFKRRTPEQSNIAGLEELHEVYDYIRMLDAEGYPHAFVEIGKFKFEFTRSSLKEGEILASVRITHREEEE